MRRFLLLLAAVVMASGVGIAVEAASGSTAFPSSVAIAVRPAVSLMDDPVAIIVADLRPGEHVTLEVRSHDACGYLWHAVARYRVNVAGVVEPATTSSLGRGLRSQSLNIGKIS